ncbi:MAG: hypothetical protein N2246_05780 [Candidatus Sumerlaeia bacterium]|nr:hypothetical protein [Candidatus Sumerlaeia bacterium]
MKPISRREIDIVLQKINSATTREIKALVNRLAKEQPEILVYLLTVNEDMFSEAERQELVYLGLVVWQTMTQGIKSPVQITAEDIITAENANYDFIASMFQGSPDGYMLAIDNLFKNYSQPALLNFIVEALMEENELSEEDEEMEISPIREEVKGYMLVSLKTIIDCLDKKRIILP